MALTFRWPLVLASLFVIAAIPAREYAGLFDWDPDTPLWTVLKELGKPAPAHQVKHEGDLIWIKRGEDLVKQGRTVSPEGKISSYLSRRYLCTHCHNTQVEDPDLRVPDPDARLAYAKEHQLPFLHGATFYGIVNRQRWFDGGIGETYGAPGRAAQTDLRKSIRLCATNHAQGRMPESWETEAILTYFWSIQLKLGDLRLPPEQYESLRATRGWENSEKQSFLEEQFATSLPFDLGRVPEDREVGYNMPGDVESGRYLYRASCMHCHREGGVATYTLDFGTLSFRHLRSKITRRGKGAYYEVLREGINPRSGSMIHAYPIGRMSDQQIEDLRAYIELMAG